MSIWKKEPPPEPPPAPAPVVVPPAKEETTPNVPQWLRTSIVGVTFLAFLVHLSYDALAAGYSEFNTSLLLIGFVGIALGYDVVGRR